jgi:hypothetical protein
LRAWGARSKSYGLKAPQGGGHGVAGAVSVSEGEGLAVFHHVYLRAMRVSYHHVRALVAAARACRCADVDLGGEIAAHGFWGTKHTTPRNTLAGG